MVPCLEQVHGLDSIDAAEQSAPQHCRACTAAEKQQSVVRLRLQQEKQPRKGAEGDLWRTVDARFTCNDGGGDVPDRFATVVPKPQESRTRLTHPLGTEPRNDQSDIFRNGHSSIYFATTTRQCISQRSFVSIFRNDHPPQYFATNTSNNDERAHCEHAVSTAKQP